MDNLIRVLLIIHIVAGAAALITGFVSMATKKGSTIHKKSGLIFFIAMLAVSISAITISLIKGGAFLFHLGIFSFYMNYTGFRSIRNKKLTMDVADWVVTIAALINTVFMLIEFQLLLFIFGIISLFLVMGQINIFQKKMRGKSLRRLTWLAQHIGMMVGTYISTLTAFLVVNVRFIEPYWVLWLLPSVVLGPLIVYWTRKYTLAPKTV